MSLVTHLPSWKNAALALASAGLLILAFPDFEYWFLAWFALVPLMWAVERQSHCVTACFLLGWLFGTTFFFGTCWWLTYAPIHYAAMPWPLAYLLIFIVCLIVGLFPTLFTTLLSLLIRRFGSRAFLAAPFVWVSTEFARYWITGNNWNAIGYSQFMGSLADWASIGGVLSVSFAAVFYNVAARGLMLLGLAAIKVLGDRARRSRGESQQPLRAKESPAMFQSLNQGPEDDFNPFLVIGVLAAFVLYASLTSGHYPHWVESETNVVAVQPNVPMSGLDQAKWLELRQRQIELAEGEFANIDEKRRGFSPVVPAGQPKPAIVILPESPMNFAYTDDLDFQRFIGDFARRNNVSVLFNSSEPDKTNGRYFNSAVMIGPDGKRAAQYDKVYLLPFGEAVPPPLENIVPAFVGHFSYGSKYDLMPIGDAKAGVMICFESHFGELGRRYVQKGADAIIEMTNDGYLGPTPVLRQHLANAVFRAVETNRPVLRVTNVGITAYIDERGNVHDELPPYTEGTRVWSVSKSDGSQTFYVKYGDWFAWLCTFVTIVMLGLTLRRRREVAEARA